MVNIYQRRVLSGPAGPRAAELMLTWVLCAKVGGEGGRLLWILIETGCEERDLLPITLVLPFQLFSDHTYAFLISTFTPFMMGKQVDQVLSLSRTAIK